MDRPIGRRFILCAMLWTSTSCDERTRVSSQPPGAQERTSESSDGGEPDAQFARDAAVEPAPRSADEATIDGSPGDGNGPAEAATVTLEYFIETLSAGPIEVRYLWSPWWAHPDDATEGTLQLSTQVHSVQRLTSEFAFVDMTVDVRDLEGRFVISAKDRAFVEPDVFIDGFSTNLHFDAPKLAQALSLPPAAEPFDAADPFSLWIGLGPESLRVALHSRRQESRCALIEPPPARVSESARCNARASELRRLRERAIAETGIDTEVVAGITPQAAVDALHALRPFAIEWPDGSVAELEVEIDVDGYACVNRGLVPPWSYTDVVRPPNYPEGDWLVEVITPVIFHLESGDARLLAEMPGSLSFSITERDGWSGNIDGHAGLIPTRWLLPAETSRPGFTLTPGVISMLSFSLNSPFDSQLSMRDYIPFAGVPDYPDVGESSSNRASCFGQRSTWRLAEVATR